jgi:hypothetical protein
MSIDDVTPEEWDSLREALDDVKKPAHYNKGSIEESDYIRQQLGDDGYTSYCLGNFHRYFYYYKYGDIIRYGEKILYLEKSRWYLSKYIEVLREKIN